MRLDLSQKPLSHLDKLSALGRQGSEKTYLFMRQAAPCIWPERHELRDEFRIDPVGFRPRAPAGGKGLDLVGWQLPRCDTGRVKSRPQPPFLTARRFKTHHRASLQRQFNDLPMARIRIRQPTPRTRRQTVNVQPIAADIYANDLTSVIPYPCSLPSDPWSDAATCNCSR